jgi:hypothetical protein
MENFTASNESQWNIIQPLIDDCDYYILIIGFNYGSIDKSENISYTEKEYNHALKINKPILSFILDDSLYENHIIKNKEKLDLFKKKVLHNSKLAQFCKEPNMISSDVITALNKEYIKNPQDGWIRKEDYQLIKQKYESLLFNYNCIINPTDFSDLKDLDTKITLTGHNSRYDRWYITTTFKSIFINIAQIIDKFFIEDTLFSVIAQKLEYMGDIPEDTITINNDSKMEVRNKLFNYKLIKISKFIGKEGKIRCWELTPKGEEYFLSITKKY